MSVCECVSVCLVCLYGAALQGSFRLFWFLSVFLHGVTNK